MILQSKSIVFDETFSFFAPKSCALFDVHVFLLNTSLIYPELKRQQWEKD